jgi:hypothetical protein
LAGLAKKNPFKKRGKYNPMALVGRKENPFWGKEKTINFALK